MATPEAPGPTNTGERPDLLTTVKEKKNLLVGVAVLVLLAFVVTRFIQNQAAEKALEPWRELVGTENPVSPIAMEPEQLAEKAQSIDDPIAAGIAAYLEAVKLYDTAAGDPDKLREALAKLESFKKEYADHPLMTRPFPSSEPNTGALPPAMVLASRISTAADVGGRFPAPKANSPPPPAGNTLTVVTEKGEIVITLYADRSPKSCAALRDHLNSLEGSLIISAIEDSFIDLGLDSEASPIDLEGVESDFPPYEDNGLSLFKGTVTFRQRPFTDGPYNASLKVWLADSFRQDDSYTVIGEVTQGLELLEGFAAEEKSEDVASQLAEPVEITELRIELPGLAEDGASDEEQAGENSDGGEGDGSGGGGSDDGSGDAGNSSEQQGSEEQGGGDASDGGR